MKSRSHYAHLVADQADAESSLFDARATVLGALSDRSGIPEKELVKVGLKHLRAADNAAKYSN
jgi:hypothetical protein